MARKLRVYSESGYMHVISRGVAKQTIFENEMDYKYFVRLIRIHSEETDVKIVAYCLMSNHFHILLHSEGDNVSQFMHRLSTSYSKYFNGKYDRVGHLFQDRFRSENVNDERYFMTVFRYIIRNPEKAGICKTEHYKWHSLYRMDSINKFVDISLPVSLAGGFDKLKEFVLMANDDSCLEFENVITDEQAAQMMKEMLHISNCQEILELDVDDISDSVKRLTTAGISQRQLQRITGITRYKLQRLLEGK